MRIDEGHYAMRRRRAIIADRIVRGVNPIVVNWCLAIAAMKQIIATSSGESVATRASIEIVLAGAGGDVVHSIEADNDVTRIVCSGGEIKRLCLRAVTAESFTIQKDDSRGDSDS